MEGLVVGHVEHIVAVCLRQNLVEALSDCLRDRNLSLSINSFETVLVFTFDPGLADDDVFVCQARPFQTGDLVPEGRSLASPGQHSAVGN